MDATIYAVIIGNWDREIQGVVGHSNIVFGKQAAAYGFDGIVPEAVVHPGSVGELSEVIRIAHGRRLAVIPRGAGTKMGIGYPPTRADLILALNRLDKIGEYTPDDMTVTTDAGVTLGVLQDRLNSKGQFLPLDPPYSRATTVGGTLATNASGPSRCAYGTARDYLIGIKVVQPDGKVTSFGGKVVKNVAGYDLQKLYIGSLGTLGVIVEANFKVCPQPEASATLIVPLPDLELVGRISEGLVDSDLSPTMVELIGSTMVQRILLDDVAHTGNQLVISFEGVKEAVAWQVEQAQAMVRDLDAFASDPLHGESATRLRASVRELPARADVSFACRANLLPSMVVRFCKKAECIIDKVDVAGGITAHAMDGIVYVLMWDVPLHGVTELVNSLLRVAIHCGGNMTVERAPAEIKDKLPVWGAVRDDFKLMGLIKEKMDPSRILNPGRFVAGI